MYDVRNFYIGDNKQAAAGYEDSLVQIKKICSETENFGAFAKQSELARFLNHSGKFLLMLSELEKALDEEYFITKSFDELKQENMQLFKELLPENYKTSYANPEYCVKLFKDGLGQIISAIYTRFRSCIEYCYKHKIFMFEKVNRLYIDIFKMLEEKNTSCDSLMAAISDYEKAYTGMFCKYRFLENNNKDFVFYNSIAELAQKKDLRYLFRFGRYVTEDEIETARFLFSYSEDKIKILSDAVVKAYISGFERDNKDRRS